MDIKITTHYDMTDQVAKYLKNVEDVMNEKFKNITYKESYDRLMIEGICIVMISEDSLAYYINASQMVHKEE